MELKDLQELVNHRLVTDITLYNHYEENPSELEKISMEDAAKMGMMSQPATVVAVVEGGVDVLPTYDSEPVEPMTFEKLVELIAMGGTVKMTNNIEATDMISVTGDVVIDMNGYTLSRSNANANGKNVLFYVNGTGSKLMFTGNGNVNVTSGKTDIAVWADKGSEVTIESCNFYGVGCEKSSDLIYSKDGKINIHGGTFKLDVMNTQSFSEPQYAILNVYGANVDNARNYIVVDGGRFFKFNPADNVSEGANTSFVADGYTAVADGDWFVVTEAPKEEIVVDDEQ